MEPLLGASVEGYCVKVLISVMRPVEPGTDVEYEKHPLDDAKSPLIRVLPAFERNFRRHALWAKAFADGASARLAQANQLLEEMASFQTLMPIQWFPSKAQPCVLHT